MAFGGWGQSSETLEGCATSGNDRDDDRNLDVLAKGCGGVKAGDVRQPAGADGICFTEDDPWLLPGVGAQLPDY